MKEQDQTSEKNLNGIKISHLPAEEFKIMFLKIMY